MSIQVKELIDKYQLKPHIKKRISLNDFNTILGIYSKEGVQTKYTFKGDLYSCQFEKGGYAVRDNFDSPIKMMQFSYFDGKFNPGYCVECTLDVNSKGKMTGGEALKILIDYFDKENEVSFAKAFPKCRQYLFKKYIPSPLMDLFRTSSIPLSEDPYTNLIKADYSSAYPSCLCGPLPDPSTKKIMVGEVEPTAEYPFCFYSNYLSAEYQSYDMRKLKDHPLRIPANPSSSVEARWNGDEAIVWTMCLKELPNRLDSVMNKFYNDKLFGDEEAKEVMNKTIGCFEITDKQNYGANKAYLSVVCKCRHIWKMCNFYNELNEHNQDVLSVITDCFIWMGNDTMGLSKEKKLGNLVLECENAKGVFLAYNVYALEVDGKLKMCKTQGIDTAIKEKIKSLDDFKNLPKLKYEIPEGNKIINEIFDPDLGIVMEDNTNE